MQKSTNQAAIVLFSGGIDSALALAWCLRRGIRPLVLEFQTPGRPPAEEHAASALARHYGIRERLRIPWPANRAPRRDGYLASRNLVMHAIAHALAEERGIGLLVAGHRESDGFPDARREFLLRLARLANTGRAPSRRTRLALPLYRWNPPKRAQVARRWDVPIDLTWSCWWGRRRPCGSCQKCRERDDLIRRLASAWRSPGASRPRPGSRASPPRSSRDRPRRGASPEAPSR